VAQREPRARADGLELPAQAVAAERVFEQARLLGAGDRRRQPVGFRVGAGEHRERRIARTREAAVGGVRRPGAQLVGLGERRPYALGRVAQVADEDERPAVAVGPVQHLVERS
jgi:hypothetical protein